MPQCVGWGGIIDGAPLRQNELMLYAWKRKGDLAEEPYGFSSLPTKRSCHFGIQFGQLSHFQLKRGTLAMFGTFFHRVYSPSAFCPLSIIMRVPCMVRWSVPAAIMYRTRILSCEVSCKQSFGSHHSTVSYFTVVPKKLGTSGLCLCICLIFYLFTYRNKLIYGEHDFLSSLCSYRRDSLEERS